MARCRMPPENSCGNDRTRAPGWESHQVEQLDARFRRRFLGDIVVDLDRLDDLITDRIDL